MVFVGVKGDGYVILSPSKGGMLLEKEEAEYVRTMLVALLGAPTPEDIEKIA